MLILPDRDVLEKIIIPYFTEGILCFAGIDKYTKHYPKLFKTNAYFILLRQENPLVFSRGDELTLTSSPK